MERTQPPHVRALLFQVHKIAHNLLYSGGFKYLRYSFLWNQGTSKLADRKGFYRPSFEQFEAFWKSKISSINVSKAYPKAIDHFNNRFIRAPNQTSTMKKLFVFLPLLLSTALAQNSVELIIPFEQGSDVPSTPEMVMLNEIAEHPNVNQLRFWVVGHTDDLGSDEYNMQLSKSRTQKVVYHLMMMGIKPYNIIFDYNGENCPIEATETKKARAMNRRVEVFISNIGVLDEKGFAGLYSEDIVSPPLEEVEVEPEVFSVDNKQSHCLETDNGTMLDIPAYAFMDAYGRPIGGEVKIEFAEYTDPFDLFLSGVDMTWDEQQLETAGIFNISATHEGKPVELRPDRPMHVDFISADQNNNFNLLFLNPNEGDWNGISHASIRAEELELIEAAQNLSPAVQHYLTKTDFLAATMSSRTTLEGRFQNMEYLDNRPIASYFRFLREGDENEREEFEKQWKREATFEATTLPACSSNDPQTVHFTVKKRGKLHQHLEYFPFNWFVWEYNGDLTRPEVIEMLDGSRFHDIRVRYNPETEEVALELKDLDEILEVPVKKVTIEDMSVEFQRRMFGEFAPAFKKWREKRMSNRFENRYKDYEQELARQERSLKRQADRFDRKSKRHYERDLKKAWKESQELMTEVELHMDQQSWMQYCDAISTKLQEYHKRQKDGQSVTRELALSRMGIYNCARPLFEPMSQDVEPRFVLSNGEAIAWKTCYLFDQELNTVIAYDVCEAERIAVNPNSLQLLIMDEEGNMYRLNETEVIAMNRSNSAQRIMHVSELEKSANSLDEMREMLGLSVE